MHIVITAGSGRADALVLRADGESVWASITDLDPQLTVALEVDRERGNWQRNLVVLLEDSAGECLVDMNLTDDEQVPIVRLVRDARLNPEWAAALAVAMANVGLAIQTAELDSEAADGTRGLITREA